MPKPRLPPTGKITSPRKKPVREAGPGKGHPKKKMVLVEGVGWMKASEAAEKEREKAEKEKQTQQKQGSKLKNMTSVNDNGKADGIDSDAEGEEEEDAIADTRKSSLAKGEERVNGVLDGGMISPESLE
jgi:hypothetical protein